MITSQKEFMRRGRCSALPKIIRLSLVADLAMMRRFRFRAVIFHRSQREVLKLSLPETSYLTVRIFFLAL